VCDQGTSKTRRLKPATGLWKIQPQWVVTAGKQTNKLLIKYCSGDQIVKNEMDGVCSTYGERRGVYTVLVGKAEGRRPLGRSINRWEDNIKTDLHEVGCEGMNFIELAQDRDR
jgi:hypothetical protein